MCPEAWIAGISDPDDCDRPDVRVFLDYWHACKAARFAPAWRDIDLMALPLSLVPYVAVVDVTEAAGATTFRYRFFGSGHGRYHRRDYTGRTSDEIEPAEVARMLRVEYTEVITRRKPVLFEKRFAGDVHPALSLRMPLSNDGVAVSGILGYSGRDDMIEAMRSVFGTAAHMGSRL